MHIAARTARIVALSLLFVWTAAALADPPPHAPAHGWRKKHGARYEHDAGLYVGYGGARWEHDYDIQSGRCNREAVATVLGGVVGGVVASRVSSPENRTVATIIGVAAGALIGNRIGHELDEADRGCFGHALEVGTSGQRVAWTNESTGVRYEMVPGEERDRSGTPCRPFTLLAVDGGERSSRSGLACRSEPGVWRLAR